MIRGTEYRLVARNSGRSESGQTRYARNQHSTRQDPMHKYTSCRGGLPAKLLQRKTRLKHCDLEFGPVVVARSRLTYLTWVDPRCAHRRRRPIVQSAVRADGIVVVTPGVQHDCASATVSSPSVKRGARAVASRRGSRFRARGGAAPPFRSCLELPEHGGLGERQLLLG